MHYATYFFSPLYKHFLTVHRYQLADY